MNAFHDRRKIIGASLLILFVFANLAVGLAGGVAGFVLLSNSTSRPIIALRHALNIGDGGSGLTVPVHQSITLNESSAIIDATKKVLPSVVAISASQNVQDYFGRVSSQETSGGSGFILTSDGLILTNRHVVDAEAKYKVVLNDGRIFDAVVQAKDSINDLAVVKINARDLPAVELGSSDALNVGQSVLAIGNALGQFRNSVSSGIISAVQRQISAGDSAGGSSETLTNLLQTDAAINPGNSGGPLVNLAGQVIGIDTAIASSGSGGGSIGIGFAIPIDTVKPVIDSVRKTGQIIRPYLGVRYVPVTPELKQLNNLTVDYGALVSRGQQAGALAVLPGSPADKAGIIENDILLEVNGERIDSNTPLPVRLSKYAVGETVTIKDLSQGKEKDLKIQLQKAP